MTSHTLICMGLLSALLSPACESSEPRIPRRVLLVGIDGASLRMIEPLLERGSLPNLASLRDQGVSGPLHSILPLQSPRIWNSIATGKRPEKHGILSFAHTDENNSLHLYLGSDRKVHALWNIVSDAKMSVATINWWNTYPPEKINGVMVSDHLQASEVESREKLSGASETPTGALIYPEHWAPRLMPLLSITEPPVAFPDPFAGNAQLPHPLFNNPRLSSYFHEDGAILRMALEVEAAEQPDVMLVFFPGIDRVSHFLWGMIEPPDAYPDYLRPSPSERKAGTAAFERYYEYTDALLGMLLARYSAHDLVLVLSDHGFESGVDLGMLTGAHHSEEAQDGVIFARGTGIEAGTSAGEISVLDITPTILTWLGLPVGEDMDGAVAGFLGGKPITRIKTHDSRAVEWLRPAPSGADEKMLENLRALGYLEDD
jgi:predicted AlkP superfamily phosphohydrolase/phosphomutase